MYGSISHSGDKASSMAVVLGLASVAAVAGLLGYGIGAHSTVLYAPSAVRSASQVAVAPVTAVRSFQGYAAVAAQGAPAAMASSPVVVTSSHSVAQLPVAILGLSAVTAFLAALLRKKESTSPVTQPLAMAATSGERLVWFPGAKAPAHLTGQYPGDRGFDPLGFSKDPKTFERMRISEVFHGRLAMLGVIGCLVPEIFFHKAAWFATGELDYKFGAIAMQVIAPLEYWRGNGGFSWNGNDGGADRSYPGFDPLELTTEDTKLREIKNGRLAMVAMLGFEAQSHITGQSPVANLIAHLADPVHNNIATSAGLAMFASSGSKTDRPLWFPGGYAPPHLTGEYPGDRGFDVFGLATDPKTYERMRISEVFHGRLAMSAVVGAVVPELIGKGAWYDGPAAADMGVQQLGVAILLSGLPEYFRGNGGFTKDATDKSYPGFDPLKLTTFYTKEAEIKNGRLAMLAIAGFAVQHQVTGKSPLEDFVNHWYNPLGANVAANLVHPPVAMFSVAGEKEYRKLWFPFAKAPSYLTGEYPADRGFDPFGLAADPKVYARMRVSEVFHGRLAMLGVVGCLWPEILGNGAWFETGDLDVTKASVIALQCVAPLEYWRGNGGFGWNGENEGRDRSYPGFDPLNLTEFSTKVAEIKNGRLAMIALAGFAVQHQVTGQSPLQALSAHLANPVGANIAANLAHPSVAMFATVGHKDGLWFPGAKPPAHLTGEFPGDRGFDPLSLAYDPEIYARMRVAEVFNGRLAMMGVVGSILPEVLGKCAWYDVGNVVDGNKVGFILMCIAAPTEYWRSQGGFGWDKGTIDRSYPGFDPLKLTSDYTKAAEVKNGRLAMSAMLGFAAQYQVTGQSPLANVAAHIADPLNANITSALAMFATSGHKDGLWFPGAKPAAHLTGEYPGDRGFDPLGLAHDPEVYARMRVAEVFNGRLAMLGVVGSIVPELLGKCTWYDVGNVVDGPKVGLYLMLIAAPTEYWRGQGGFGWDKGTMDRSYPGFDPLKLTTDYTKVAEVKNGRLAMAAILGFAVQAQVTGQSPLANVAAHVADPLHANITSALAVF